MKRTIFYDTHIALGAKMAPFGGYDMPIQYEGIFKRAFFIPARKPRFSIPATWESSALKGKALAVIWTMCFRARSVRLNPDNANTDLSATLREAL